MHKNITLITTLIVFAIIGCTNQGEKPNKPTVSVSIIPQKFFVEQIAGTFLHVNVMVPPGSSPASYEPTPKQMKDLSQSIAYLKIGHIGFEQAWMSKLSSVNPKMKIIDTAKDLPLVHDKEFNIMHTDDHGHSHSHDGYNPHIWLSPKLVKMQGKTILNNLIALYPNKKEVFESNYNTFSKRCDSIQSALDSKFTALSGTHFIVYHPVWTYLAKEYNLKQIAIEHNGKEATADKLKEIIDYAKSNNIKTIFVQKEFSDTQAQTIAKEINGKVVALNPLDYDWFKILNEFKQAF